MSNYLYCYKGRTENFYTFEMVPEPIKLNNINDQMKKVYQIQSLNSFIQGLSFSSVEIIGHDFGIVDKPYFVELNKYLNRTAIINYWLYNMSLKNIKYKELQAVFPQNKINIIPNK